MKPFRATYTPKTKLNPETHEWEPDTDKSRIVLVVAILSQGADELESVAFIDSDNSLKSAYLDCFTDCQSTGWSI